MIGYHRASRSLIHLGAKGWLKVMLHHVWCMSRGLGFMRLGLGGKVSVLWGKGMHAWRSIEGLVA